MFIDFDLTLLPLKELCWILYIPCHKAISKILSFIELFHDIFQGLKNILGKKFNIFDGGFASLWVLKVANLTLIF